MPTNIRESINRGNNLVIVGLLMFTALIAFPEVFREDEWLDKADDIFITLVGIGAVIWYLYRKNRYQRSWVLFGLLIAAFAIKVLAYINEFNDPFASGDDLGLLIPFGVMVVLWAIILYRTREKAGLSQSGSSPEMERGQGMRN